MNDLTPETIDKLRQIQACRGVQQLESDSVPYEVIPDDCKVESLREYVKPKVIHVCPKFKEVQSFIEYVEKFATEETILFASPSAESVVFIAIIDYHHGTTATWCKHRAEYVSELTPEFKTWRAANRKKMDQVEFATWLEDNASLFLEPTGAELLELVRDLHGHKNARFSGEVRLATGNYSVAWEEETVVQARQALQSGKIELPKTITAAIPPFFGAKDYAIQARLKTKVEDRKLFLWYETIAEHTIMRDSIGLTVAHVSEALERPVLIGTP